MRLLLKLFSKKSLWNEILSREGFSLVERLESGSIWNQVFHQTPILKDWLKRREMILLKSVTLQDKEKHFILGQIAENRLYQKFDTFPLGELKEAPKVEKKLISRDSFLSQWERPYADNKEQSPLKGQGSGKGSEEKPSGHSDKDKKEVR